MVLRLFFVDHAVDVEKLKDLGDVFARFVSADDFQEQVGVAAGQVVPDQGIAGAAVVGRQGGIQAAIEQVSEDAQHRDFRAATPDSRIRSALTCAIALIFGVAILSQLVPAAASNAFARLTSPWGDTPRYTFAAREPQPAGFVVAHGEPFHYIAKLATDTAWKPATATARLANQQPIEAEFAGGVYSFDFPAQIDTGALNLRVGDASYRVDVEPKLRPELTAIVAKDTMFGTQFHPEKSQRFGLALIANFLKWKP